MLPNGSKLDYRLNYISPTITRWFGHAQDECIDNPSWLENNMHPEDAAIICARKKEFFRRASSLQLDLFSQDHLDCEYRLRCKDGIYRWVHDALTLIRSESGDPFEVVGSLVMESQQIEQSYLERERKYRDLVESSREVLWMLDPIKNQMLYLTPAFEEIWGRDRASMYRIPQAFWETIHPQDRQSLARWIEAVHAADQEGETQFRIIRPEGSIRWIRFRAFPIRDPAASGLRFGGIADDITERKYAEAELGESRDQLRALSAYLQTVREEEKNRISRELHDELGSTLLGLKMDACWIASRIPEQPIDWRDKIDAMIKMIEAAIGTTRRICTQLRPAILDDLGLVAAISWQAREFETHCGIKVRVNLPAQDSGLDEKRSIALFRILQESLTNIARHAAAAQVAIDLIEQDQDIVLLVKDDGRGIDSGSGDALSHGIRGMQERARHFGGDVKILGEKGQGTLIVANIPRIRRAPERESA